MIPRNALTTIYKLQKGYPIVAVTGPRQSGKTTLVKIAFPHKPYVSLETPSHLDFAQSDPIGFLKQHSEGMIIDEVQNAPHLFSYLQEIVDHQKEMGQFVLTGSQQFDFLSGITQSLPGRVGLLELLPFSLNEIQDQLESLDDQLFKGFYPAIYDRKLNPRLWYEDYVKTYLERDVRKMVNVKDLNIFRNFLKLCAGRNAQVINFSGLCTDSGLNKKTVKSWLSILEASFIIYFIPPYFRNFSKRMIKSPKLYFYDSGLVGHLLGLNSAKEVLLSTFKGAIFESMVMSEVKKYNNNYRKSRDFYFWKDHRGVEVDLVFEKDQNIYGIEIKSGQTIQSSFLRNLEIYQKYINSLNNKSFVIYAGEELQERKTASFISWKNMDLLLTQL